MLLLGEAEREDRAVLEQLGGAAARGGVVALPDRAEPENRDLPRVPVRQAVEAGDLAERADARGVPALVRVAGRFRRGRQQRREDALALDELQEVGVPGALVIVLLERRLAAGLEEVDRGQQRSSSRLVEVRRIVRAGIEQDGPRPFLRRWGFDGDRTLLDAGHAFSPRSSTGTGTAGGGGLRLAASTVGGGVIRGDTLAGVAIAGHKERTAS